MESLKLPARLTHAMSRLGNERVQTEHYDAIVIGLGGMGSAALAHLALRGRRVLGLEQYQPAHALGSSHGGSRIIRKAYYEDPSYVPLVLRAYELWHDLERRTGTNLLIRTGGLMAGYEGCEIVDGAARSARDYGLAHEILSAGELRRRFPVFRPREGEVAVYEPDAGVLNPEQCVLAHLQLAVTAGAEARFGVAVRSWHANDSLVGVTTADASLSCDALVLCAGPWLSGDRSISLPLQVERNVMHWFDPAGNSGRLGPSALPVYIVQRRDIGPFYGVPLLADQGLKAAFHYSGEDTTPDRLNRAVTDIEIAAIRSALSDWLPDAAGQWRASSVCMYTNTPDKHFIIGQHPEFPRVTVAAGFSGHGFKFCPVVGEILAGLALDGGTSHRIEAFSPLRFSA